MKRRTINTDMAAELFHPDHHNVYSIVQSLNFVDPIRVARGISDGKSSSYTSAKLRRSDDSMIGATFQVHE